MTWKLDFNLGRWLLGFSTGSIAQSSSLLVAQSTELRVFYLCLYVGPLCIRFTRDILREL